jgi:D-methionine transport system ATP-binding protein
MFHAERPEEAADQALIAQPSYHASLREGLFAPARALFQNISVSTHAHPPNVMRIDGVSKAFGGHRVLNGISLDVPKGSIHGIIGKSGAGKTTLIRIAGLLEKPDSGLVRYEGIEPPVHLLRGRALLEARRKTGFVFQSFNLFASRTAGENVAFPLEAAGWPHAKIRGRVAELLDLVGLSDKADRPAMHLSGGEKQRIAIARALANRPSILFSDEATSALDPETTRSVLGLIRSLREMLGLTVIMVTHQMEVVRRTCDTVSVIEGGTIVEQGLVSEVFTTTRSDAARAFLKEDHDD